MKIEVRATIPREKLKEHEEVTHARDSEGIHVEADLTSQNILDAIMDIISSGEKDSPGTKRKQILKPASIINCQGTKKPISISSLLTHQKSGDAEFTIKIHAGRDTCTSAHQRILKQAIKDAFISIGAIPIDRSISP